VRDVHESLREHEDLLRQYSRLVGEGTKSDHERVSELEQMLRVSAAQVEKKQFERDAGFEKVVLAADRAWGGAPFLSAMLRDFKRDLKRLPIELNYPPFNAPIRKEEWFLQRAVSRLEEELKGRGVQLTAEDPIDAITEEIHRKVQAEARLRQKCDEDVRMYPDQEETIRRSYRRAIDALREQP